MARRNAAYAFYLAVFGIFTSSSTACHAKPAQSAASSSQSADPNVCALEPTAQVSDACISYADLDTLNTRLSPSIRALTQQTDFFGYYRLNLYNAVCPFWSDANGLCGNIACAVTTLENEEDVPVTWRAEELGKLQGPKAQHPGRVQQRERQRPLLGELGDEVGESCVLEVDDECDERDYCVPEDESASAKGDYVSLNDNPERFTGYSGEAAHQVWEAIYRENCFSWPDGEGRLSDGEGSDAAAGLSKNSGTALSRNQAVAASNLKQVFKAFDRQQAQEAGIGLDELSMDLEDQCVEKRVFYRIISGMHASISTHLCHEYLNQTTGEWSPNLQCYRDRLHNHPERIANLYFNYALVLRAVGKLRAQIPAYTFCTGDAVEDARTKAMLVAVAEEIPTDRPAVFDERTMFRDTSVSGRTLKEDFRMRFRNVSRIMDCVGCDKCRLWGKIQTNGLGTALKVLFEFGDEEGKDGGGDVVASSVLLRRTELVALVNTLDKISAALKALETFRGLLNESENASVGGGASSATAAAANSSPSAPITASAPLNFDDLHALDDFDGDLHASADDPEFPPVSEIVQSELALVASAFLLILRAWIRLPQLLGTVMLAETQRVVDGWLGRPVIDRGWSWGLEWPDLETLRDDLNGRREGRDQRSPGEREL